ncbi:Glycerol-3-phosphate acyltransferase [Dehalogenimonas formicexedens]|uniref:Glycerol-3-phosphate acyltransferase n=1 Tax=Dehalogenimonas formicexedens TaxID=1839801 RepID=A0A1P8F8Y1_9CHLR|nr:glycerol-3-phosphate acyltransferase [Dehalogenimonas formicexedens]APV44905.1 Glycerol-3-phosphate acyltransferase [Dehalogenimonas formicexedens]
MLLEGTIVSNIAVLVAAYFIGAFPQLLLMAKYHHIEPVGDLHHAIWKKAGPVWGLSASAIDVLKGIGTVWLARSLDFEIPIVVLAALAATCGQMWPVFKKFDGEKGNTTGFGAAANLAFWPAMICLTPVFLAIISKVIKAFRLKGVPREQRLRTGAGQSNALPLGVGVAFLVLPLAAYLLNESTAVVAGFAALFVLVMVRRLTAGLSADLATSFPRGQIFWSRLLLDRPIAAEA